MTTRARCSTVDVAEIGEGSAPSGSWRRLALCAEVDADMFFPERGESTEPAKAVCRRCEVRPECLRDALRYSRESGVWGGMSEQQRRRLLRAEARRDGAA